MWIVRSDQGWEEGLFCPVYIKLKFHNNLFVGWKFFHVVLSAAHVCSNPVILHDAAKEYLLLMPRVQMYNLSS